MLECALNRHQNAMRRVLEPLTNALGRRRSRTSSLSSFDLDLDDDDGALKPVGDQIGHVVLVRRSIYLGPVGFMYALRMLDGTERTHEDIVVDNHIPIARRARLVRRINHIVAVTVQTAGCIVVTHFRALRLCISNADPRTTFSSQVLLQMF